MKVLFCLIQCSQGSRNQNEWFLWRCWKCKRQEKMQNYYLGELDSEWIGAYLDDWLIGSSEVLSYKFTRKITACFTPYIHFLRNKGRLDGNLDLTRTDYFPSWFKKVKEKRGSWKYMQGNDWPWNSGRKRREDIKGVRVMLMC